jgi:hypothetical protein
MHSMHAVLKTFLLVFVGFNIFLIQVNIYYLSTIKYSTNNCMSLLPICIRLVRRQYSYV